MRTFIAGLKLETNSWVAQPTHLEDFTHFESAHFRALRSERPSVGSPLHQGYSGFLTAADSAGADIIFGPASYATPGGPVDARSCAILFDRILTALAGESSVDLILLDLHGAMAGTESEDSEGDLLEQICEVVNERTVIAALLDPHASLTQKMVRNSNLLHCYKEYPHTDIHARAVELFHHAAKIARGAPQPHAAIYDCAVLGAFPTVSGVMRDFVDRLLLEETRNGIISASLVHGFPWSDTAENGAKLLVYSDHSEDQAREAAIRLGEDFRRIVRTAAVKECPIPEGIAHVLSEPAGPILVADTSDNPGGGADGDATFVLKALLEANRTPIGVAVLCDPESYDACTEAGIGTDLRLRLGGKAAPTSGLPLELDVRVEAIVNHLTLHANGAQQRVERGFVRVRFDGGDIILSRHRQEALWPELFVQLGTDPLDYEVLLLKSSNHFRAGFGPYARSVISISSPAVMNPCLSELNYKHLVRPVWPMAPWKATHPQLADTVETRIHV